MSFITFLLGFFTGGFLFWRFPGLGDWIVKKARDLFRRRGA